MRGPIPIEFPWLMNRVSPLSILRMLSGKIESYLDEKPVIFPAARPLQFLTIFVMTPFSRFDRFA